MVKREIYSVGLKRKVDADVQEIIATPSRGGGFRYQVVGTYEEGGKTHKCQSMIGKADAEAVAASLGQSLPTTDTSAAEEVESFAAETDSAVEEEPELLVPDPQTSPMGDGRVYGQHTGGQIIMANDDSQSLPAHDYVWAGRAEGESPGILDKLKSAISRKDVKEEIEIPLDAGIEVGQEDMEELAADSKGLSTLLPKAEKGKRVENYDPDVDYGSQFTNLEEGSIYETHTCCCGMPCDSCGKSGLCGKYGMMYDTENNVVSCAVCRGGVMNAEVCAAEFEEVIPSVDNVWDDDITETETFVVEEPLKDFLIEEFYDEVFEGHLEVKQHDAAMNTWEVTFSYFLSEDIIDAIADYQEYGFSPYEDDEEGYTPTEKDEKDLADWVKAEEFAARGMVDSDDLFGKAGISKSTAAIATAVLALGAAWWWSQRK